DGSAHGGCEASCTLFWKDVWLKPVAKDAATQPVNGKTLKQTTGRIEEVLTANTQLPIISAEDEPCYSCQATKLFDATEQLAWWNVWQYVLDVVTGNHSVGRVLKVLCLSWVRQPYR